MRLYKQPTVFYSKSFPKRVIKLTNGIFTLVLWSKSMTDGKLFFNPFFQDINQLYTKAVTVLRYSNKL